MNSLTVTLLPFALIFCYCQAAQFSTSSPDDGDIFNVCVGDTLVLPWTLLMDDGDVIEGIKWYFTDHTNSKELIAVSANGVFFAVPAYTGRLSMVNETTLLMNNVTEQNAGNFSVDIVISDKSDTVGTLERSVQVEIGDGLQTTDRKLHVIYTANATRDNTGHWSVQLLCGTFTYLSRPPFDVQWQLPSGRTIRGTSYSDGHFILELSGHIERGNYTCQISSEAHGTACLDGSRTNSEATVYVDSTEVRLVLIEAQQAALQKENDVIKMENSQLKTNLTQQQAETSELAERLTEQQILFEANMTRQQSETSQLKAIVTLQQQRLSRHVSFHAWDLHVRNPRTFDKLIFKNVRVNQGGGYDNNTGIFTAPFNGTYFFAVTTGSYSPHKSAYFDLIVDEESVSSGSTTATESGATTSIQALVSLWPGQQVRVRVYTRNVTYSINTASAFSGFLLYSD